MTRITTSRGELMIVLKDSARNPGQGPLMASYQLDDDRYAGFMTAVENGQMRLALEYAVHLMTELNNEIFYLRRDIDEMKESLGEKDQVVQEDVEPEPEKSASAPAKKATKKAAKAKATAKPDVEEVLEKDDED